MTEFVLHAIWLILGFVYVFVMIRTFRCMIVDLKSDKPASDLVAWNRNEDIQCWRNLYFFHKYIQTPVLSMYWLSNKQIVCKFFSQKQYRTTFWFLFSRSIILVLIWLWNIWDECMNFCWFSSLFSSLNGMRSIGGSLIRGTWIVHGSTEVQETLDLFFNIVNVIMIP